MKWMLILAAVLLAVTFAYADETSGATYSSPNGEVNPDFIGFLNDQECIDHTHQYSVPEIDDRENPMGLGVDAVVWQNEKKNVAVEVQEKYDIANEENSVFAVVKVNLFELLTKKAEPVQ